MIYISRFIHKIILVKFYTFSRAVFCFVLSFFSMHNLSNDCLSLFPSSKNYFYSPFFLFHLNFSSSFFFPRFSKLSSFFFTHLLSSYFYFVSIFPYFLYFLRYFNYSLPPWIYSWRPSFTSLFIPQSFSLPFILLLSHLHFLSIFFPISSESTYIIPHFLCILTDFQSSFSLAATFSLLFTTLSLSY